MLWTSKDTIWELKFSRNHFGVCFGATPNSFKPDVPGSSRKLPRTPEKASILKRPKHMKKITARSQINLFSINTNMIDKIKPLREHGNDLYKLKSGIIRDHTKLAPKQLNRVSTGQARFELIQIVSAYNRAPFLIIHDEIHTIQAFKL